MAESLSAAKRLFAISAVIFVFAILLAAPTLALVAQELIDAREIAHRYNSYRPPLIGNWVLSNDTLGWSLLASVVLSLGAFGFLFTAVRYWYSEFRARQKTGTGRRSFVRLPTPRRYGIATLLAVVAFSAIGFTTYRYFSASARYQRNGDVETLRYLLSTRIDRGDTMAGVTSILGTGRRDDGAYVARLLKWKESPNYDPRAFSPDGLQDGDLIIHYSATPKPSYGLQFRKGVLVNHDPNWYVGPDDTISALSK